MLCHKKPAERNIGIDRDQRVIDIWRAQSYPATEFIKADALEYLRKFKFTGEELIYCDPPYMAHVRRRNKVYRFDYTYEDHEHLLDVLLTVPCMVMISGYNNDLYNARLIGWEKATFNAKTHTDVRREYVWMNFKPGATRHDARYLGADFRERQTIKRRQQRLFSRIEKMDPIERHQLAEWIAQRYPLDEQLS